MTVGGSRALMVFSVRCRLGHMFRRAICFRSSFRRTSAPYQELKQFTSCLERSKENWKARSTFRSMMCKFPSGSTVSSMSRPRKVANDLTFCRIFVSGFTKN